MEKEKIELVNLWINIVPSENPFEVPEVIEIRADWSNDFHQAIRLKDLGVDAVSTGLMALGRQVMYDNAAGNLESAD